MSNVSSDSYENTAEGTELGPRIGGTKDVLMMRKGALN